MSRFTSLSADISESRKLQRSVSRVDGDCSVIIECGLIMNELENKKQSKEEDASKQRAELTVSLHQLMNIVVPSSMPKCQMPSRRVRTCLRARGIKVSRGSVSYGCAKGVKKLGRVIAERGSL
jgi:hypothetical protein